MKNEEFCIHHRVTKFFILHLIRPAMTIQTIHQYIIGVFYIYLSA